MKDISKINIQEEIYDIKDSISRRQISLFDYNVLNCTQFKTKKFPMNNKIYTIHSVNKPNNYYFVKNKNVSRISLSTSRVVNDAGLWKCEVTDGGYYMFESVLEPGNYLMYDLGNKGLWTSTNHTEYVYWNVGKTPAINDQDGCTTLYSKYSNRYLLVNDNGSFDHAQNMTFNNATSVYSGDFIFEEIGDEYEYHTEYPNFTINENSLVKLRNNTHYYFPFYECEKTLLYGNKYKGIAYDVDGNIAVIVFTCDEDEYTFESFVVFDEDGEYKGVKVGNNGIEDMDNTYMMYIYSIIYDIPQPYARKSIRDEIDERLDEIEEHNNDLNSRVEENERIVSISLNDLNSRIGEIQTILESI